MQVYTVTDGILVEPNCAYVIPPNKDMALKHNHLILLEPSAARGRRFPIDSFFRSLAQGRGDQAVCIVLSGTGSDGTLGLKEVKAVGGMAMVQAPETADYDGMPRSAIQTDLVDFVLPPDQMPARLISYVEHSSRPDSAADEVARISSEDTMRKVFLLLHRQTGQDFSLYKRNTINRRIERRMAINQIERLEDYVHYLTQNPVEVESLFRELLIGVTGFFRDPEAFKALKESALLPLLKGRQDSTPLRIWVPGCATGEEAYSLAIMVQESADTLGYHPKVQIFATDIDGEAIEKARAGAYPNSIAADITSQRLDRFFSKQDNSYQIRRGIRDMIVFATQNVAQDPPFSKMDLVCCRNLLIYLGPELQKKVIPLFHYALNRDGYLFLGGSETIGKYVDLFEIVDRKWKLYQRRGHFAPIFRDEEIHFPHLVDVLEDQSDTTRTRQPRETPTIRQLAEKTLLKEHTPPSVVINERGDVLYVHGRTGQFLELPGGDISLNILHMAREGLNLDLSGAIRKVSAQRQPVRVTNLRVKTNGGATPIELLVSPLVQPFEGKGLMLVVFRELPPETEESHNPESLASGDIDQRIAHLEHELRAKNEYLQTTIEEIKSTNEELQSSNEELQSTNEELETSKEELQSVNEELATVNTELQQKIELLYRLNNDMSNLLAGTGVATLYLDRGLTIRRFTPAMTKIMNLIETDVGRPVSHIAPNLVNYSGLLTDVREVLDHLVPKEARVQTSGGGWFLMRILPYRTNDDTIDGVVITFLDITDMVTTESRLQELADDLKAARDYAESIVTTVREPLLVLNAKLEVISANPATYNCLGLTPEETIGRPVYDLNDGQWDDPELRRMLQEILPRDSAISDFKVSFIVEGRHVEALINARELKRTDDKERLILLAVGGHLT
jgi:two-component system, chemotaxis family, CheB/CheR fusion protein